MPKQSNNLFSICACRNDCGFHMLMHTNVWDGHSKHVFEEKDIPNLRKILTHRWHTHSDNEAHEWKTLLKLE
ncbi:hypothetical protein BAE44_0000929 [Dichanthelium oligosanthes]|uniref:Uncharacterized protein n=1 Tax=Dichanthelium oligosanthes TaxID=888268 RepID=A0A1E5WKV1_9POAL|nr:hypothetical protein BAE44_0000929 [Dichanthelium oligosanthes]